jgi:predicted NBD/HSP70 family sugar kinase
LGIALAYYVDLTNPELIVIGGGVGRVGDLLLDPLRATIKARALPINTHGLRVVRAALADAGAVGAAALVWMNSQGN